MAAQGHPHLLNVISPLTGPVRRYPVPPWLGLGLSIFVILSLMLLDVFEIVRLSADGHSLCRTTTELFLSLLYNKNINNTAI